MKESSKELAMFDMVENWQKSGKSQKKFSSENNVKFHTFSYWVQRYKQSKSTNPGFAAVTLTPELETSCSNPRIEIELAGDIVVRIF
jgi:transposase-like protein